MSTTPTSSRNLLGGDIDTKAMGRSLLDGYNCFMKAFDYDSLPMQRKGKTENSRKTVPRVNVIVGHTSYDSRSGRAVDCWLGTRLSMVLTVGVGTHCVDIPSIPTLGQER